MKNKTSKRILSGICVLVLTALACNLTAAGPTPAPTPTPAIVPVTGASAAPTETATQMPTTDTPLPATAGPTETSNAVTVTAKPNGSLGILRGPSIDYDTLGYLENGQTSTASARNSDGSWLYMYVPNYPTVFGWAYVGSQYSTTQGDVNSLPVKLAGPAVPAYIQNCTFHPMLLTPGGTLLQPQTDLGNRIKQFPPGSYMVYDQSAQDHPQVMTITLKEGMSVDIETDGLNNTYKCP